MELKANEKQVVQQQVFFTKNLANTALNHSGLDNQPTMRDKFQQILRITGKKERDWPR